MGEEIKNEESGKYSITVAELKNFLNTLPNEFDSFNLVNGEYGQVNGEHYYRIDKPILQINVDEDTKELCILHQTETEVDDIITGPAKDTKDEKSSD